MVAITVNGVRRESQSADDKPQLMFWKCSKCEGVAESIPSRSQ